MHLRPMDLTKTHKRLSPEDQKKLAKKAKIGDIEAREQLWNSINVMAIRLATKHRVYNVWDIGDLVSVAYEGFAKAIENYKPRKSSFNTYVYYWMDGYIRRYKQNHGYMVRIPCQRQNILNRISKGQSTGIEHRKRGRTSVKSHELEAHGIKQTKSIDYMFSREDHTVPMQLIAPDPNDQINQSFLLEAINGSDLSPLQIDILINHFAIGTDKLDLRQLATKHDTVATNILHHQKNAFKLIREGPYGDALLSYLTT